MEYFDVTLCYTVEAESPEDAARKASQRYPGLSVIDARPTLEDSESTE